MDQPAATSTEAAAAKAPDDGQPADADEQLKSPGFRTRGGVRRRARFLRKARELAYRDLGGLVFDLHRFGQRNDALVIAKLATLSQIDSELRALESSLGQDSKVTVLREAGITACPRCAVIHSGEDHFCPRCGLPMSRNVDLPVGGAPASTAAATPTPPAPTQARHGVHAPLTTAQPAVTPPTAVHTPAAAAGVGAASASGAKAQGGSGDEPTEIIRPPATGK